MMRQYEYSVGHLPHMHEWQYSPALRHVLVHQMTGSVAAKVCQVTGAAAKVYLNGFITTRLIGNHWIPGGPCMIASKPFSLILYMHNNVKSSA